MLGAGPLGRWAAGSRGFTLGPTVRWKAPSLLGEAQDLCRFRGPPRFRRKGGGRNLGFPWPACSIRSQVLGSGSAGHELFYMLSPPFFSSSRKKYRGSAEPVSEIAKQASNNEVPPPSDLPEPCRNLSTGGPGRPAIFEVPAPRNRVTR